MIKPELRNDHIIIINNIYFDTILFIFVNSHCTHGTSCVNNPYYIGDRTQFIGTARMQFYIGRIATLNTVFEQNIIHFNYLYNNLIDDPKKLALKRSFLTSI